MLYFNPTFDKECPSWLYISYGIGLFLYQTFDACDGLQARRTGQSGPLGELFDHCVDALNTTLEVLIFASVTNMGYGWGVIVSQFATLLNFYLTTWEEYHTETLFLSEFSGPVEGIVIVIAIYIITAFTGPQFWHSHVFSFIDNEQLVNQLPSVVKNMTLIDLYLVLATVGLLFNIQTASSHVFKARKKNNLALLPAIYEVIPFVFFFITLMIWISISPKILYEYLLPLTLAMGIISAFTVGRIITAHVTKQEFPLWNPLLLMPTIGIAVNVLGKIFAWNETLAEVAAVWTGLGLSIGVYASFIGEIIQEITNYLDIGCLHIKHKQEEKNK